MRILISGDHHFDEHKRFAECIRVHRWMVDVARERGVDLFLSGGDVYEGASTPLERQATAEFATEMTEVCPSVIVKGNHDKPLDCEIFGRLRTRHPLIVEERCAVHMIAGAAVAACAWPDPASIAASLGDRHSRELADVTAREAFRNVLLHLGNEMDEHRDAPRILLGHFMIDGSITSTGQPLLGMPLNLGLADLALARPRLCVAGHIHKSQRWDHDGVPYLYPGSPFRTDFGQLEPKVVVLATFDGPNLVDLEWIETPATRMVHLEGTFAGGALCLTGDSWDPRAVDGAEVRFRYHVAPDDRDAAKREAAESRASMLACGALTVQVEEVVRARTRARVPELATAPTLEAKLEVLWNARREQISAERKPRIFAKLAQLEQEARDAA